MLKLVRIKPNPTGKDRSRFGPLSPAQLGAEWIDIHNFGGQFMNLDGVGVYHVAYGPGCTHPRLEQVVGLQGILGAGKTVRVHAGEQRDLSFLYQADLVGAEYHVFTGADRYIWNNTCGDTATLFHTGNRCDQATYSPNPPEGAMLVRQGDRFVSANIFSSPPLRW